ncbi:MAG TPA: cytochrome b562 [Opitutaceae bacterium]|jgi:soluble cytochrome b562
MKIRPSLACLLALPFIAPTLSRAQTAPAPAPAAPAPAAQQEKDTDLEVQMKRVGKAFKALRKQVADPAQNESSLKLVATMQDALKNSLALTPEKASDLPEDQRPKFIEDFKAGLKGMQDELDKLSGALTAGKNDDAAKIVTEIFSMEKKDHKEFRRPPKD